MGGISTGEIGFSGSGAVGATVNLKKPFVMDQKPTEDRSQALDTQELLLSELVTECAAHNGHSEHWVLVYRIATAESFQTGTALL